MTKLIINGIEEDLEIGVDKTPCKNCGKRTLSIDNQNKNAYKCSECGAIK